MKNCANRSKAPYNGDVALSFDNDVVDDEGALFSPLVPLVPLALSEASLSPVAATSKK